jgi:hypothetical protein
MGPIQKSDCHTPKDVRDSFIHSTLVVTIHPPDKAIQAKPSQALDTEKAFNMLVVGGVLQQATPLE